MIPGLIPRPIPVYTPRRSPLTSTPSLYQAPKWIENRQKHEVESCLLFEKPWKRWSDFAIRIFLHLVWTENETNKFKSNHKWSTSSNKEQKLNNCTAHWPFVERTWCWSTSQQQTSSQTVCQAALLGKHPKDEWTNKSKTSLRWRQTNKKKLCMLQKRGQVSTGSRLRNILCGSYETRFDGRKELGESSVCRKHMGHGCYGKHGDHDSNCMMIECKDMSCESLPVHFR